MKRDFKDDGKSRVVVWYSHGDASAVSAKLALTEFGHERVTIACIDVGSEHPDNERFRIECEQWFQHPITMLKSAKYANVDEVFEGERYLVGHDGAPCTKILKKAVRQKYEDFNDIQIFGYTAEESERADDFATNNFEVMLYPILIKHHLTKNDCHAIVADAGIELPMMYRLGYANNNCIGCVKGGMGYWNKIRIDFPSVFARRARQEREIDHGILKDDSGPIFLDELKPGRGRMSDEPMPECSLMCSYAKASGAL